MRTFMLLVLTFVTIDGSRQEKNKAKEIALKETIESLKEILQSYCGGSNSSEFLNKLVTNIYEGRNCSEKSFCQARKALTNFSLPGKPPLLRQLHTYAKLIGHENCTVSSSSKIPVCDALHKIQKCCKYHFSKIRVA